MIYVELRAFHAVATSGGFSAAARRARVTQPTLSSQVAALEARFGVTLFHRRGRKVLLTPLGEELVGVTRRLFDLELEASALLAAAQTLKSGQLRLGADSPHHVVARLAAFTRAHPGIKVSLSIGNSAAVLADPLEYRIDVAVLADVPADPRLVTRALRHDPVVAIVPRAHPFARRRHVTMAELARARIVMREKGSITRAVFERALAAEGLTAEIAIEMDGREAMREAVAAGLGVGIVSAAEFGTDSRLVTVPLVAGTEAILTMTEYLVRLAERRPARPVQAFLALFEKAVR